MATWNNQSKNTTSYSNQSKNTTNYKKVSKSYQPHLQQENGFALLQENGGLILLESAEDTSWTNQAKN